MHLFANILWFLLGGCVSGILWLLSGLIWCLTIVGIPIGVQCFKYSVLAFAPFGRKVTYGDSVVSVLCNIIWLLFDGWILALINGILGLIFCITIIGIPFGLQYFKLAKLSLFPFGSRIQS